MKKKIISIVIILCSVIVIGAVVINQKDKTVDKKLKDMYFSLKREIVSDYRKNNGIKGMDKKKHVKAFKKMKQFEVENVEILYEKYFHFYARRYELINDMEILVDLLDNYETLDDYETKKLEAYIKTLELTED